MYKLFNGLVLSFPLPVGFTYCYFPLKGSVFKARWDDCPGEWHRPDIAEELGLIRSVRDITNKALDLARSDKVLRSSLEARALLQTTSKDVSSTLRTHLRHDEATNEFALSDLLLVSQVGVDGVGGDCGEVDGYSAEGQLALVGGEGVGVRAVVRHSTLCKCPRCWKYTSGSQEQLCDRCAKVVSLL